MKLKLLVLFLPFLLAAIAKPSRELISMAVGHLTNHVVTSREVNINFFVESVLYGKRDKARVKKFYNVKSAEFSREVTAVLLEWVVYRESKAFTTIKVPERELHKALLKFMAIAKSRHLWPSLHVSHSELRALVTRKLRAKKFVRFKVDSSVVPITEDEARKYFKQNRLKFGNLPFDNFKQNIIAYLSRKQVDRRLKDWFDVLQNKYQVRNFLAEVE